MFTDKDTDRLIGKYLKEERDKHGYSLEYVGNLLGVNRQTIHLWEKGTNAISASALKQYCDVLGIPLYSFTKKVFGTK